MNAEQAQKILQILKTELARPNGLFKTVNRNILNDFLPANSAPFNDAPCLGHFWEFQYALAVELEHGKTRGTNVTNNHPVLTGMVAMAHLTEDTLYYARLWVMEGEGECFNALREGKSSDAKLAELLRGLDRAKAYLAKRMGGGGEGGGGRRPGGPRRGGGSRTRAPPRPARGPGRRRPPGRPRPPRAAAPGPGRGGVRPLAARLKAFKLDFRIKTAPSQCRTVIVSYILYS
ncbi:MAG: hypothetical protein IPF39_07575 [Comamonadaceae bacterium]|uniref:DUF5661 family protein n=1 Tax=Candidatus Skiveiella danica TaxID=3386177 RepID=UPI00390B6741|nr:hypothetical protein [Comamonadaceae bacterium]